MTTPPSAPLSRAATPAPRAVMQVEIWSDVVCPWCFIGKRRFERALAGFAHRDTVAVRWRSFELDPAAPPERPEGLVAHLAAKYGTSEADARGMQARVSRMAAEEGLSFDLARARPGSTFDAHRLLHHAAQAGVQDALKERLLSAHLERGLLVSDPEVLAGEAEAVGLDRADALATLHGDAFAAHVREDEATARRLGISGVPFFVVDRAYGASGAQPPAVLRQLLEQAWGARAVDVVGAHEHRGGDCADGSCAV